MLLLNNYHWCDSLTFFTLVHFCNIPPRCWDFLWPLGWNWENIWNNIMLSSAVLPSLPLSVLFCLAHCISLPSVLLGACCRPLCLNLGVRTHREAGVYSAATPVKNTFPWKCSHPAHSKTPRKTRIAAQLFGLFGRKHWKTAWGFELLFFTGARIKQIMLLFIVSLKQFYENKMC